jgi:MscS family membrane protein
MEEYKFTLSVIVVLLFLTANAILKKYLNRRIQKYLPKTAQNFPFNKLLNYTLTLVLLLALISIWGVNIQNIWIYFTGILTVIAIGLFAVWSILSNIVAALILMGTGKFKNGDQITIYPEKIEGTVLNISLFFVILKDKKGYVTYIPNNQFFQKVTKKKESKRK